MGNGFRGFRTNAINMKAVAAESEYLRCCKWLSRTNKTTRTYHVRAYVACMLRSSMSPERPTGMPLEIPSVISPVFPSRVKKLKQIFEGQKCTLTEYLLHKDTLHVLLITSQPLCHGLDVDPVPLALLRLVFRREGVFLL